MTKTSIGLQDLRRRIYLKAKADQEWRFWGLYVHVCKPETLREAYEMARRNGGAAGIDGVTFADIEEAGLEAFLDGIHDELVSRLPALGEPAGGDTFPAPPSSNPACRFPALGFPVAFLSRFMRPFMPGGVALLRRRPRELRRASRQELLDASKAWWGGWRGRLADRRRRPFSVSLGVIPLVFARFVEVPVRVEVAAGP